MGAEMASRPPFLQKEDGMQIIKAVSIREGLKENFFVAGDVEEGGVYAQCTVETIKVETIHDHKFVVVTMLSPSEKRFEVAQPFKLVNQIDFIDDADIEEWDQRLATLRAEAEARGRNRTQ